jgi:Spy/CpxP family protein refolding chaperone
MRVPVWFVAAAVIVMSLLTGVVLGVAVDRRVLLPGGPFFVHRTGGFRGPGIPHHLASELGLSPAQSAAVDSIMRHRMSQRDSLMAHTWPVMRQLLDSTRSDIERILTPEQRAKFEQLRYREFDGPPGIMIRRSDGPPER